jgi:hypothetical protein
VGVRVRQRPDVGILDNHAIGDAGGRDVRLRTVTHQRRDVRSDHLRLVLPREPDRGGPNAAADVQHPLAGPDGGELEQPVGRGPASGMNDPLAQDRQERVGVQRPHLLAGQRRHSSHLREIQENA